MDKQVKIEKIEKLDKMIEEVFESNYKNFIKKMKEYLSDDTTDHHTDILLATQRNYFDNEIYEQIKCYYESLSEGLIDEMLNSGDPLEYLHEVYLKGEIGDSFVWDLLEDANFRVEMRR